MSATEYFTKIQGLIQTLSQESLPAIEAAAESMANSIAAGRVVYYFGSGHSVIPVLDVFPRYGSFVGLQPVHNTPLMWTNVIGPGGTPELLWIERQEGYVANVFRYYTLDPRDTLIVVSHGGLNAAPVEAALLGKQHGLTVVAITSLQNRRQAQPRHSSGQTLADAADIVIDNGASPEDALIHLPNWPEPVAAASTVTALVISMALVAETAVRLSQRGIRVPTFVSPNVMNDPDHNLKVYDAYRELRKKIY
jgi:uncharacterized phosphosugar-binding protein